MDTPSTPETCQDTIPESLTPREIEVLQALTAGMSNPDIATELHLSLDTVKTHVRSILHKLQARNRTHAVVCALIAGIVLLPASPSIDTKVRSSRPMETQQGHAAKNPATR